jgi:hypothetical protein
VFAALVAVALFSVLTVVVPKARSTHATVSPTHIDAVALARALVENPGGVFVVDLRADVPADERIPGAVPVSADDPDAGFIADLPATRRLVLYGQGDLGTLPEATSRFTGTVYVLDGGYEAFERQILTAPELGENSTREMIDDYQLRAALHAHFTGAATTSAPPPAAPKKKIQRKSKKEGGC